MAFGLATEDDDAQMLTKKKEPSEAPRPKTRTEQLKERLASDPPRVRFVKFFEANNLDLYRFLDANNLATIDDIDEELAEMALTEKGMKALRERYKR